MARGGAVARRSDDVALEATVAVVARDLVDGGRFVPALDRGQGGRWRSWWWPLPAAADRLGFATLVDLADGDEAVVAARVVDRVDALVRMGLVGGAPLLPSRPGRPGVVEAWLRSLTTADPWLADSLDDRKVSGLAGLVEAWVRSGAVVGGACGLVLRVVEPTEPEDGSGSWAVELLVRDAEDPSCLFDLAEVWSGDAGLGSGVVAEVLGSLVAVARAAPGLAGVLDEAAPDRVEVDACTVVELLRDHAARLDEAGVEVLVPGWWSHARRPGLRARAKRAPASAAVTKGGVGLEAIVAFTFEAALGEEKLTKADLARLAAAARSKVPLVRMRGQWVRVDLSEVEALLRRAGTVGEATVAQMLRAGLGLAGLGTADGGTADVVSVDAKGVRWLHALLDGALHATVAPIPTPHGFRGALRPYQERGVGWLTFLGVLGLGACLADDMGLGKTAQLIATLLADPLPGPTLVVCPVSVLGNWERELARFVPHLDVIVHHGSGRTSVAVDLAAHLADHDVVLTAYSLLALDQTVLASVAWARVVFDEAQQIKNPSTAQAKAAGSLKAERRIAMTGTPVENRLSELWSIMHVLNPGLLGSQKSFRQRFSVPIERHQDEEATALLRRVTQPFVLRRLKSDKTIITDLPDKIETVDRCRLTSEQASLYAAVVEGLLDDAEETDGIQRRGRVLAGLLRLKQVCNHPALLLADGSSLAGRSGKLSRIEELLEEILDAGDKVLCFTQFASWGKLLQPYFARRFGVDPWWLHGGVRRAGRDTMVANFAREDGPSMFLISLKAGGTGLNLTAASHVIHLDRWWNPAVEDQATDRAYRIGQVRTVQVHKPIHVGTIEERIDEMITAKRSLATRVVGTGEDWLTKLSTDELRDLVSLRDSVDS